MNPENKTQIQANRRKIFELEVLVNQNKTKVEICRASIEQNYASYEKMQENRRKRFR